MTDATVTPRSDPGMRDELQSWREAKRVFDRLAHLPTARWRARLGRLQLDASIRERVEKLFSAKDRAGLLDTQLLVAPGANSLSGRQVGNWVLENELGRGATAVVYSARAKQGQTERLAAVKLITLGGLAHGVQRFEQEQRILARLNHPHIAQLYDFGQATDGTPWYSMALVNGDPIDVWCRTRALQPRAIVELFLDVCDAAAYAHRNLVIHRDIKPSNVLVDENGHVRLLDFGIARLLDDTGEATATQWRALTPQYAAPEQFAGALPSTSMDVYGLGALLYRLLAGRPPRSSALDADLAPVAPSRVDDAAPDAPSAATRRELSGDLDRTVLKALAQDSDARYGSVADFALDLRNWLSGKPVSATEPSLAYRVTKFVSRHRLEVFAAAALLFTLVGGIVATSWEARRAEAEARRAQAVGSFVTSLLSESAPGAPGGATTDIRDALVRGAARARKELVATPSLQVELLLLIGSMQLSFDQYEPARRQLQDALALSTGADATPSALRGRILTQLGELEMRADGNYQSAISRLDAAVAELKDSDEKQWLEQAHYTRAAVRQLRGEYAHALDDLAIAESLEAALPHEPWRRKEILELRGRTFVASGRFREAQSVLSAARDSSPDRPVDYSLYLGIGNTSQALGQWPEAEAAYRRALALVLEGYPADSPVRANPHTLLANFLRRTGRLEEAESLARAALLAQRRTLPPDSPSLATGTGNLGVMLRDLGKVDEALEQLRRATVMADSLYGPAHPISAHYIGHTALALAQAGHREQALHMLGAVDARIAAARALGLADPRLYASTYTNLARVALLLEDADRAIEFIGAAEAAESPDIGPTSASALNRSALRIKALMKARRPFLASANALELRQRIQFLRDNRYAFHEQAETLAILAQSALQQGEYETAMLLATAAISRQRDVTYPSYVEAELDLVRPMALPAAGSSRQ